jgi:hypothetical protein
MFERVMLLAGFLSVYHTRQQAEFGISLPALSADALSTTLYGHLTWHPLSRAER